MRVACSYLSAPDKTLIDWISNESVGFLAFNFAACVTNFFAVQKSNRIILRLHQSEPVDILKVKLQRMEGKLGTVGC